MVWNGRDPCLSSIFVRVGLPGNSWKRILNSLNIPLDGYDKNILKVCGTESGRNIDKVKEAGLTLVESDDFSVPGVKELPLTLEYRVVFRQKQELDLIAEKFNRFYPQDVPSEAVGANKDVHIAYYGEIVGAYIAE